MAQPFHLCLTRECVRKSMYKGSDNSFSFAFFSDNKTTKESFGLCGKLPEVLGLPSSERSRRGVP